MNTSDTAPRTAPWHRASELPPEIFAVWRKPNGALSPVAIVSTVDEDGTPRSAPFGGLRAVNPCLLRFGLAHFQATFANLRRDGRVAVTMVAALDIAVSVRGHARVIREHVGPRLDTLLNKGLAILCSGRPLKSIRRDWPISS